MALGVFWFLIIDTTKIEQSSTGNNMPAMRGESSSISYSASKEITSDNGISDGEYQSQTADENASEVELVLDASSSVTLTGDSYIKSLSNADTANSKIHTNGYKLYANGKLLN